MIARSIPKALVVLVVLGSVAFATACDGIDIDGRRPKSPAPEETTPEGERGPRELDVARPDFQAKSSAQLARSIDACVGDGARTVTASMIATPENPEGFLTTDFAVDSDIVEVQAELFDGVPEALRTGVRVDQVSLGYVTALKNVANVVGSRCATGAVASPGMCSCATEDEAKAMLARCLTAVVDPMSPEFETLARDFAAVCATSRGTAIASMIASLAFAKLP